MYPARNGAYTKDKRSKAEYIQKYLAKELMLRFDAAELEKQHREHSFSVAEPKNVNLDNKSVEYLVNPLEAQEITSCVYNAALTKITQTERGAAEEFCYYTDLSAKATTTDRECYTERSASNLKSELETYQGRFDTALKTFEDEKNLLQGTVEQLKEYLTYLSYQHALSSEQIDALNAKCLDCQRQHDCDAAVIAYLYNLTNYQLYELQALRLYTNRGLASANSDLSIIYNMLATTYTKYSAELQQAKAVTENFLLENEYLLQKVSRGADMIQAQTAELLELKAALNKKQQVIARITARLTYFCTNLGYHFEQFSFAMLKEVEQKWATLCDTNDKLKHYYFETEFQAKERQYYLSELRYQCYNARDMLLEQKYQIQLLAQQKQAVQADNAMYQRITSYTYEELAITRKQNETLYSFIDYTKKELQSLREKQKPMPANSDTNETTAMNALAQCKTELEAKALVITQLERQNAVLRQQITDSSCPIVSEALPSYSSTATQTAEITAKDTRNATICNLTAKMQQLTSELEAERKMNGSLRYAVAAYTTEAAQLCYQIGQFLDVFPSHESVLSFLETQPTSFGQVCAKLKAAEYKLYAFETYASNYKQALEAQEAIKTAQVQQNEEQTKCLAATRRENAELKSRLMAFEGLYAAFALKDQQVAELTDYLNTAYAEIYRLDTATQIANLKSEELTETIKTLRTQLADKIQAQVDKAEKQNVLETKQTSHLQDTSEFDAFRALAKAQDELEIALAAEAHGKTQISLLSYRLNEYQAKNAELYANHDQISEKYQKMLLQMAETGKQLNSTQQFLLHEENCKRLDAAAWSAEFKRNGFTVRQYEAEIASLKHKLEYQENTLYTYKETISRLNLHFGCTAYKIAALEASEQQQYRQIEDLKKYIKLKETLAFYIYQQHNEKDHGLQISAQRIVELQRTVELVTSQKLEIEYEQRALIEQTVRLKAELLSAESQLASMKHIFEAKETEMCNISYYEKHVADLLGKLKGLTLENDRLNRMLY